MIESHMLFFTASIINWYNLLKNDKNKQIIIDSLNFLVKENRINVYGFVIMPNHIHLLWRIKEPHMLSSVQRDFLKYTAQNIKFSMNKNELKKFVSQRKDRKYQFWQDNSFNRIIHNRKVAEQKLDYIHNNPISKKWNLVNDINDYKYSSAGFYYMDDKNWSFLTHISEHI